MPKDKRETYEKIIPSAKKEFMEKGFQKASMRSIAAGAGITAAGLYRHFTNKEAMFEALVEPALNEFYKSCHEGTMESFRYLTTEQIEKFWRISTCKSREAIEFIYEHIDEFKLLFNSSEGTKYENIRYDMIMMAVNYTKLLIKELKQGGVKVKEIQEDELYILYSAQIAPMFEIIKRDYSKEHALKYADLMSRFFNAGWEEIFHF